MQGMQTQNWVRDNRKHNEGKTFWEQNLQGMQNWEENNLENTGEARLDLLLVDTLCKPYQERAGFAFIAS